MQHVFVLSALQQPLMPTHPASARKLLSSGRAAVYRMYPFTIILRKRQSGFTQPLILKIDPGSKTTGLALLRAKNKYLVLCWAAHLVHRGWQIKRALEKRSAVRRDRRKRKTRFRPPRFNNRKRTLGTGWLPPSLQSRVDNIDSWVRRLRNLAPIHSIEVEMVRLDVQKLMNPDITNAEYQQGTLLGYEVREWLLENRGRACAYCRKRHTPLQVEHVVPISRGGSNRLNNLTLACASCNQAKGAQTAAEFGYPRLQLKTQSYRDAAAVNTTRHAIVKMLKKHKRPVLTWSGGLTKYNRIANKLPKAHYVDAACIGLTSTHVTVPTKLQPLQIRATGRGTRQQCRMDRFGFPRTKPKQGNRFFGFRTGDIVHAAVPSGLHAGQHRGRIAVRARGYFRVGNIDGIHWRFCRLVQAADGYDYTHEQSAFV